MKCPVCGKDMHRMNQQWRCKPCLRAWTPRELADVTYDCGCRTVFGRQVVWCKHHAGGHPLTPETLAKLKPDKEGA